MSIIVELQTNCMLKDMALTLIAAIVMMIMIEAVEEVERASKIKEDKHNIIKTNIKS